MKWVGFDDCVGWIHEASGKTGVVLCAAFGHEYMWSQRAMRFLADELASAGVPVLRFDYPDTGDSPGLDDVPVDFERCARSVVQGARTLRARAGVDQVVLCGLRLGAIHAVMAAEMMADEGQPAAGMVLLAPPANGRAYLRELRSLQMGWLNNVIPDIKIEPRQDGSLDVLGYRFEPRMVAWLEGLRLDRRPTCPVPRVLLLDAWPSSASPVAALATHYDTLGAKVTLGEFAEYFDLVRSADSSIVPERAWQEILEWLGPSASVSRREATAPIQALERISMPGMTERATMVGQHGQFGMLCEPDAPRANGPAFLFTNTGGNHHVGDCRMYVMLARQLAQMGYASVRMDISLMGDSAAPEHELNIPQLYASGIPHRDVTGAIEWMRARGHERVIVMGICSGAYHAFHAALACPTVVGAVVINVVKFRWESEDGKAGHAPGQSIRVYRAALANPGNWVKLLTGRLNVMPHAVSMMHRLRRRLTERVGQRVNALRGRADDATPTGFARQAMLELERRGVLTDLIYGAGDIGLDEARSRLGAQFEMLDELEHVNAFVFERFDHALFLPESRATLRAHLFQHIERQQALARSGVPVPAVATRDISANSVRA